MHIVAANLSQEREPGGQTRGASRPISEVSTISLTVKTEDTSRAESVQPPPTCASNAGRLLQTAFPRRPTQSAANHRQFLGEQSFLPSTDGIPRVSRAMLSSSSSLRSVDLQFDSNGRDVPDTASQFSTPRASARLVRKRPLSSSSPTSIDPNMEIIPLIPASPESMSAYVSSQMSNYRSRDHSSLSRQTPVARPTGAQLLTASSSTDPRDGRRLRPSSQSRPLHSVSEVMEGQAAAEQDGPSPSEEMSQKLQAGPSQLEVDEDFPTQMSDISEAESKDYRPALIQSSSYGGTKPMQDDDDEKEDEESESRPPELTVLEEQHSTPPEALPTARQPPEDVMHPHHGASLSTAAQQQTYRTPEEADEHDDEPGEKELDEMPDPICQWQDCDQHFTTQVNTNLSMLFPFFSNVGEQLKGSR